MVSYSFSLNSLSINESFFKEFAEFHRGPISNHKFNEAINGVFRHEKMIVDKRQKLTQADERRRTSDGRQQTLYETIGKQNNRKPSRRERLQSKENHLASTIDIDDENSLM